MFKNLFSNDYASWMPEQLLKKGTEQFRSGKFEDAIKFCTLCIDKDPYNWEAYLVRGDSHILKTKKNIGSAHADFVRITRDEGACDQISESDLSFVYINVGYLSLLLGPSFYDEGLQCLNMCNLNESFFYKSVIFTLKNDETNATINLKRALESTTGIYHSIVRIRNGMTDQNLPIFEHAEKIRSYLVSVEKMLAQKTATVNDPNVFTPNESSNLSENTQRGIYRTF